MSAFKHTPGPWHAVEHYSDEITVTDSAGFVHVSVENTAILLDYGSKLGVLHWADDSRARRRISDEEQAANARLIAAAPELMRALGEMLLEAGNLRSETIPSDTLRRARAALAKATGGAP